MSCWSTSPKVRALCLVRGVSGQRPAYTRVSRVDWDDVCRPVGPLYGTEGDVCKSTEQGGVRLCLDGWRQGGAPMVSSQGIPGEMPWGHRGLLCINFVGESPRRRTCKGPLFVSSHAGGGCR